MRPDLDIVLYVLRAQLWQNSGILGCMHLFTVVKWEEGTDSRWDVHRTPTAWLSMGAPEWMHECPTQPHSTVLNGRCPQVTFEVMQESVTGFGEPSTCGCATVAVESLLSYLESGQAMPAEQEVQLWLGDEDAGTVTVQAKLQLAEAPEAPKPPAVAPQPWPQAPEACRAPPAPATVGAEGLRPVRRSIRVSPLRSASPSSSSSSDEEDLSPAQQLSGAMLRHWGKYPAPTPPCSPSRVGVDSRLRAPRASVRCASAASSCTSTRSSSCSLAPLDSDDVPDQLPTARCAPPPSAQLQAMAILKTVKATQGQAQATPGELARRLRVTARKFPLSSGGRGRASKERFFAVQRQAPAAGGLGPLAPGAGGGGPCLCWFGDRDAWRSGSTPLGFIPLSRTHGAVVANGEEAGTDITVSFTERDQQGEQESHLRIVFPSKLEAQDWSRNFNLLLKLLSDPRERLGA